MSKWISVKDELPDRDATIDIWVGGKRVCDCVIDDSDFCEAFLDYDGDCSHPEALDVVTHWMYSPEPPEEE